MFDVGTTLIAAAARDPRRLALTGGGVRPTCAQLLDRALRIVNGLAGAGLRHGDRVLAALQNPAEMAILHWAASGQKPMSSSQTFPNRRLARFCAGCWPAASLNVKSNPPQTLNQNKETRI
jgi:non-ribosomal peptide synthetase component E (peptide arylation enzyme)